MDLEDEEKILYEKDRKMVRLFRKVFSDADGRQVLRQILTDLHYFDECVTNDDVVRNNYAKFMIKKRLMIDNKERITDALFDARESF